METRDSTRGSPPSLAPPDDEFQRALEHVFAPLTPEVMRATLAFEQIADVDSTGMANITERVWYETAVTLIADAMLPKFDLERHSPQSEILQRRVNPQLEQPSEDLFERARSTRIRVMRRIVEQMLKGLATVRSVPRPSVDRGRSAADPRLFDASRELPASVFVPSGDPVAAFQAREGALIALASMVPDRILPLPGFRQIMDRRLQFGRGENLLQKLHVSLRKARRRTRKVNALKVDSLLLTMAQQWVNPDYPLWMMREPVATRVLELAFRWDGNITQLFRDRRQDHFPGNTAYMILDVAVEKLPSGVRRIKAYKLAGEVDIPLKHEARIDRM